MTSKQLHVIILLIIKIVAQMERCGGGEVAVEVEVGVGVEVEIEIEIGVVAENDHLVEVLVPVLTEYGVEAEVLRRGDGAVLLAIMRIGAIEGGVGINTNQYHNSDDNARWGNHHRS